MLIIITFLNLIKIILISCFIYLIKGINNYIYKKKVLFFFTLYYT